MDGSMQDGKGGMLRLRMMDALWASWAAEGAAAGGATKAAGCRWLTDGENIFASPVTFPA